MLTLNQWYTKNDIFFSKVRHKKENITHYRLNGGCLCVPLEKQDEFLQHYMNDIANGEKHYICERRTEIYRMMGDLDYVGPSEVDREYVYETLVTIQNVARAFFPNEKNENVFDILVCRVKDVKITKDNLKKVGIHFYFPHLFVNDKEAMYIREMALTELDTKKPRTSIGENSWSDVLDQCVYTTNGLRMLFSRKMAACPDCAGRGGDGERTCGTCCGAFEKQKIDVGRPYVPWFYIHEGKIDEKKYAQLTSNRWALIMKTSLRVPSDAHTKGFAIFEGAPVPRIAPDKTVKVQVGNKVTNEFHDDYVGQRSIRNRVSVPQFSDKWRIIDRYIRKFMPHQYREVIIRDIVTNPTLDHYIVTLRGKGSHYCLNKRDYHNGNSVYFFITKKGVHQKCFCRCQTTQGRQFGLCRKFLSKPFKISTEMTQTLFPSVLRKGGPVYIERHKNRPRNYKKWEYEQTIKNYIERIMVLLSQDDIKNEVEKRRRNVVTMKRHKPKKQKFKSVDDEIRHERDEFTRRENL